MKHNIIRGMVGSNLAMVEVNEARRLFGAVVIVPVRHIMNVTETKKVSTGGGYFLEAARVDPKDGGADVAVEYNATEEVYELA